jgi:hypothetical protein
MGTLSRRRVELADVQAQPGLFRIADLVLDVGDRVSRFNLGELDPFDVLRARTDRIP